MDDILLEIGDDNKRIRLMRIVINSMSFYEINFGLPNNQKSESSLFLNIEDAWNAMKHQFPQWHLLSLIICREQIRPALKNDFFSALIKEDTVLENWLVILIGYGIHWM